MKKISTGIFSILLLAGTLFAQKVDSIEYQHGFLYFHEYGNRSNDLIILLTGGPGNKYVQLEEVAKTLSPDYWCIIPEQRGTGRSIPDVLDSVTVNVKAVTDDIKLLLEKLNQDRAHILGHSWGGMLAMNFAVTYPSLMDKLILIGPGPISNVGEFSNIFAANRENTYSYEEFQRLEQLNEALKNATIDSSAIEERTRLHRSAYIFANPLPDSIFRKINIKYNAETRRILWSELTRTFDIRYLISDYEGSIDIITGRQDPVGYVSYDLKILQPLITLYWIEECGHFPMYEKPEKFYEIVHKILE